MLLSEADVETDVSEINDTLLLEADVETDVSEFDDILLSEADVDVVHVESRGLPASGSACESLCCRP